MVYFQIVYSGGWTVQFIELLMAQVVGAIQGQCLAKGHRREDEAKGRYIAKQCARHP